MDARTPHYLRFARTLALATTLALPACADDGAAVTPDEAAGETPSAPGARPDPTARLAADALPTPSATSAADTDTATDTETAENETESDAGAEGDASYAGKSSGPLPPPEMPSLRA